MVLDDPPISPVRTLPSALKERGKGPKGQDVSLDPIKIEVPLSTYMTS